MLPPKSLSNRQRKFCIAYISNGFCGLYALRAAGYSDSGKGAHATHLLKMPKIKQFISQVKSLIEDNMDKVVNMSIERKLTTLETILDQADRDPSNVIRARAAIAAIAEANKMQEGHLVAQKSEHIIKPDSKEVSEVKQLVDKYSKDM